MIGHYVTIFYLRLNIVVFVTIEDDDVVETVNEGTLRCRFIRLAVLFFKGIIIVQMIGVSLRGIQTDNHTRTYRQTLC